MAKFWQPVPNVKGVYRTTDVARPFKAAINASNSPKTLVIIGFYANLETAARAYDGAARNTYKYPLLNFPKRGELRADMPEFRALKNP